MWTVTLSEEKSGNRKKRRCSPILGAFIFK
jgi:hypothetical protein